MNVKEIKRRIKSIPVSDVLEAWEPDTLDGICCFHQDTNAGSFKYKNNTKNGGIYTCFVCGQSGDKIDFVMKHDGVDFNEAILRIALRFDVIDERTYKQLSKNPEGVKYEKLNITKVKDVVEAKKQGPLNLNCVYEAMREYYGLSEKHKEYLLGRGVKEENLSNYFSLRKGDEAFFNTMKQVFHFDKDKLIGVPGFYVEGNKIATREIEGIAIPMHNANGLITAIQIRKDEIGEKGARYIFFSSSKKNLGCSSGSAVDIIDPDYNGTYFVTEGHFKAMKLHETFGVSAISVQGVNNIEPLKEEIPALLAKHGIRRFIIAYDADMKHNPNVKKAAKKLQKLLESFEVPTGFMVWDEQYGKGADDVIEAGHRDKFRFVKNLEEE